MNVVETTPILSSYVTLADYMSYLHTFYQWLVSDHKFNYVQDTPNLSADQAHIIIQQKGHRQWKDLSKAFISLDGNKSGTISKSGLRELLQRFILPMTEEEFNKLWRRYDI